MKTVKKEKREKALKLNGKAIVFIDWANVYGWEKSLKVPVDTKKLFKYLKTYSEIEGIYFYYGKDNHPKSREFLQEVKKQGYKLVSKPVKHIVVKKVKGELVTQRKCDFDIEIVMDTYKAIEDGFNSFVFLSGDGDFEPLYKYLLSLKKQVIAVYARGHLGKEVWKIKKGLFKIEVNKLAVFKKK